MTITKIDLEWGVGILVGIAAIIAPFLGGKKRMSQSQNQVIRENGSQKQSQKMEG